MNSFNFTKENVDNVYLITLVKNSVINKTPIYVDFTKPNLNIVFDVDLTPTEVDALTGIVDGVLTSTVGTKNFLVKEYDSNGRLNKDVWYNTDNGDGTYSGKVEETEYVYNGNKVNKYFVKEYWLDGTLKMQEEYRYFTNGNNVILKKV
jgi:hypothetical protein